MLAGRTVAQRRRVFQKWHLFGEDERDGVEGVFGEELGAAEDDDDEAEWVEHLCDEEDGSVGGSPAGVRRAMAMALPRAERPMKIPPARPEMARETLERPSSWRALLATCS